MGLIMGKALVSTCGGGRVKKTKQRAHDRSIRDNCFALSSKMPNDPEGEEKATDWPRKEDDSGQLLVRVCTGGLRGKSKGGRREKL